MTVEELKEKQKIIEKNLESDLRKLEYLYAKSNTSSKMNRILYDLAIFSNIYSLYYPNQSLYLPWYKSLEMDFLFENTFLNKSLQFNKYVVGNNDLYNNISSSVIKSFYDYPFYKYMTNKFSRYSNKDLNDSMFEFLNSYDSKLCKKFRDKIKDLEIFYNVNTNKYIGVTFDIRCLNKNYITLNFGNKKTIENAETVMHEFGHVIEFESLYNRLPNYLIYDIPFYEINSSFFEYAYINYLKENKLFNDDLKVVFDSFYKETLLRHIDIFTISSYIKENTKITIYDDIVNIDDEEVWKEIDRVKDKLNYYVNTADREPLNFKDTYIYGIGKLFAVILYDSYKNDPNNFKKEFANALCNYPLTKDISAFSNLGINEEELISGNILKKRLDSDRKWYNERVY